jgi:hypothetical protein
MKDAGIYVGASVFSVGTRISLGNLQVFSWWQLILIGFFLLLVAIFGGFAGMVFQDEIQKFGSKKWIGKKREPKPST